MILVAGGTGRLGTLVVERLRARGLEVRVLTRDAERAAHLPASIDVCVGDVRSRDDVDRAARGASTIVSAVHGFPGSRRESPTSVDRDGNANLTDAAATVHADVVLVSGVGVARDSSLELFRMKFAAEQYLAASTVPATIVRATAFLELWMELLETTVARSGRPLVFGRGENPINFVSVVDVADAVERSVVDPDRRGSTVEIAGPQNLTLNELAATVQQAAGRSSSPRHVPPRALWLLSRLARPIKPGLARQAAAALAMDRGSWSFTLASARSGRGSSVPGRV